MGNLVYLNREEAFTDSMVISKATGNQHKSIVRLIKQHQKRLEKFGRIEFSDLKSTNPKGGRPTTIYLLNEPQATLLITFLDNNDKVADFKTELVKQFFEMKMILAEKRTQQWVETRIHSKLVRRKETDTIKSFIEYAKDQGSKHADKYYIHFSNLANKFANITNRDASSIMQLSNLSMAENIILNIIEAGIISDQPYKDIYKECRERLDMVNELAFLDKLDRFNKTPEIETDKDYIDKEFDFQKAVRNPFVKRLTQQ